MKVGFSITVLAIALAGCGGGSDGDEPQIQCLPAAETYSDDTAQNAGIYRGYLEIDAQESAGEAFALLTPSGRIAVLADNGVLTGFFSDGIQVSGNVDLWTTETEHTNYSLNGIFTARDSIQGYNLGIFDYEFRAQYQIPNEDICLATVDATGSWTQTYDGVTTTLTLDAEDDFTGSDSTGCVYSGSLNGPSVEGGVFDIQAEVANCEKSGNFTGVGTVRGTEPKTADLISGVMWNDDRYIGFNLER